MQQVRTYGGWPTPLGGTSTLTFASETTIPLPYDASTEAVAAALKALNTVGPVVVLRDGPFGQGQYQWNITFRGNDGNQPMLIASGVNLIGTDPVVNVTELQAGDAYSLYGMDPKIVSEDLIPGRPNYIASYRPAAVGRYSLAVRQLLPGGLNVQYFDSQWLQGAPVIERIDPQLNFNWGNGLVTPYGRDYVSARWWGKIRPYATETFTFFLFADEGARMWLDHELVIDTWDHCCEEAQAYKRLIEGTFHDLRVEWKELTGAASISLKWASLSTFKQVVPTMQLFHTEHIVGSPFNLTVVPCASDCPYTSAWGPGLEHNVVGTPTYFYVPARDANTNNKTEDGDDFYISIDGPASEHLTAYPVYQGGGLYRVDYTLTVQGNYTITIQMGGTDIYCGRGAANKCSPFAFYAEAAALSFETTDTYGPGLQYCVVGDVHSFIIAAYDTYKNRILHGGDTFNVTIVHTDLSLEKAYPGHVVDTGDGFYHVTYTTEVVGDYTVNILHDGQVILTEGTRTPSQPHCYHAHLHGPSSVTTRASACRPPPPTSTRTSTSSRAMSSRTRALVTVPTATAPRTCSRRC
jgi:hypothetical protein